MELKLDHITFRGNKLEKWTLDERVRRCLEGSGFDNPVVVGNLRVNLSLISALLECYDADRHVFSVGGNVKQDICFGLEDILYITGFPIDGKAVTGLEETCSGEVCERLLGKNGCKAKCGKPTSVVPLDWLQENFMKLPEHVTEETEEFKFYVRAYVLFVIGRLIAPDAKGAHVSVHYLPLLEDITGIKKYAWGAAILAHLHWSLKKVVVECRKDGAGFYYALMVFALERLPPLAQAFGFSKEDVKSSVRDFPLALSWADQLERCTRDNHHKRSVDYWSRILSGIEEDHIEWQPYLRLDKDRIPRSFWRQTILGTSRTPILCFEKVAYHRPDLSPRQFGLEKEFECTLNEGLVDITGQKSRSGPKGKDWSTHGCYKVLNEEWNRRHTLLINFQEEVVQHSFETNVPNSSNPLIPSSSAAQSTPTDSPRPTHTYSNTPLQPIESFGGYDDGCSTNGRSCSPHSMENPVHDPEDCHEMLDVAGTCDQSDVASDPVDGHLPDVACLPVQMPDVAGNGETQVVASDDAGNASTLGVKHHLKKLARTRVSRLFFRKRRSELDDATPTNPVDDAALQIPADINLVSKGSSPTKKQKLGTCRTF